MVLPGTPALIVIDVQKGELTPERSGIPIMPGAPARHRLVREIVDNARLRGVPVVAAVRPDNFPGIALVSGENITLVEPNDPADLAAALCGLLDDPSGFRAD